jgi:hypothetical protein
VDHGQPGVELLDKERKALTHQSKPLEREHRVNAQRTAATAAA